MRTLEQILEGVTAGGKWRRRPFGFEVQMDNGEEMAPVIMSAQNPSDAAYTARAARNFPALVRALEKICKADTAALAALKKMGLPDPSDEVAALMKEAHDALTEALKD